jgi:uncharacterized protein (TIGR03435 family)
VNVRLTIFAAIAVAAFLPAAATIGAQDPRFDVVSVRPNVDPEAPPRIDYRAVRAGRVTIQAMSLRTIMQFVYPEFSRFHQVQGGPSWVHRDRFNVEATFAAGSVPPVDPMTMQVPSSLLSMLRSMLADRFKLKLRTETREVPIYALVAARKDGQLGPNLKRSAIDCTKVEPMPSEKCGMNTGRATGLMTATGLGLDELANWLELMVRLERGGFEARPEDTRPVQNMTGLSGPFDFTYDQRRSRGPDAPSIFTVIQESYGLRLEPRSMKAEILVIEYVEHPSPN